MGRAMRDRSILITGAASGIGAATARLVAAQGDVSLFLVDRSEAGLEQMTSELQGSVLQTKVMDVADPDAWADFDFREQRLTGAVICAGVSEAAMITDMRFDAWRHVLSVNLDGAFLSLQAALRHADDGASIVAVSSATGHKAAPMTAAYGASKAGLSQLVKVAALEVADRRIRVNAVAPGGVRTPMFSEQSFFEALKQEHGGEEGAWTALAAATPLKRFAEPEEIAGLIALLLGPETASMTGTVLNCDGGYGL